MGCVTQKPLRARAEIRIAAAGDNCMDVYQSEGRCDPGGNPVNVAVYAVRLGCKASYTGVVGTDRYGELMRQAIREKGVDVSHLTQKEGKTAVSYVEIVDGDRVFGEYEEGVMADFAPEEADLDFLCGHDLVVTGIWGRMEHHLAEIRARGVPVAFDFATKIDETKVFDGGEEGGCAVPCGMTGELAETARAITGALPWVNYAFFSSDREDEELRILMKRIHASGPELVIATRGRQGSIAYDGSRFTEYGIIPCEVVDAMGAGDSYIAGFLIALLEGRELTECMRCGAENSSVTLQYAGAWEYGGPKG